MIKTTSLLLCLSCALLAQPVGPAAGPSSTAPKPEAPTGPTDPAPGEPLTLDSVLKDALANHAQIRLAEAKIAEAEAQLSMAKLELTRQIASTWSAYEAARQRLESMRQTLKETEQLHQNGSIPGTELRATQLKILEAKLSLESLARELNLIRTMSKRASGNSPLIARQVPQSPPTVADLFTRIRGQQNTDALVVRQVPPESAAKAPKAPSRTHKVEVQLAAELGEIAETSMPIDKLSGWIQQKTSLAVIVDGGLRDLWKEEPEEITIPASKGLNTRQFLALLADHLGLGFVVREYGLFVVERDRVEDFVPAQTIPEPHQ